MMWLALRLPCWIMHAWAQPAQVDFGSIRTCRKCGQRERLEPDMWNAGVWVPTKKDDDELERAILRHMEHHLQRAHAAADSRLALFDEMREALAYYADNKTHAIRLLAPGVRPAAPISDDHGKRAKSVLARIEAMEGQK